MQDKLRFSALLCFLSFSLCFFASKDLQASGKADAVPVHTASSPGNYELPFGSNPFAPSNAKTLHGGFISQGEFTSADRCARCHWEAHSQWSESAHRNSFREPFYQTNVKHLIKERGIAVTRHCESCHNPAALFSGALSINANFQRPMDEQGVTCVVCHSIRETTTTGIGSYTIAKPALLEKVDGQRIEQASDETILKHLEDHRRAMMRPLLKTSEFCAACHKAAVVPELNGRKWLRSFAVYDEWQQSAFSNESAQPLAKRDRQSCQSCHMPENEGLASHRWVGANTGVAKYYGFDRQYGETEKLLKSGIIALEIFVDPEWRKVDGSTSKTSIPVDVVAANRGVGHSFPAELRDIFEAWIEFEALDSTGRLLLQSGTVQADGSLEPSAHAYRTIPLTDDGLPVTKHDIWNVRIGAFDRSIAPGRADVACFTVPLDGKVVFPLKFTAKLHYRRFTKAFNEWAAKEFKVGQSPVVEMASVTAATDTLAKETPLGWRAYGVALLDHQQYEAAILAFERGLSLTKEAALLANLNADIALTCLKMERIGDPTLVLGRAEKAIGISLSLDSNHARSRYYRALLNLKRFRYDEALQDLVLVSSRFPRDRQVWTQLGALYLLLYRDQEALSAYENVLRIDPDDTEAHLKLTGLYWRLGKYEQARKEQLLFSPYHIDTSGESLKRNFLKAHPELLATRPWREVGDNPFGTTPNN